MQKQWVWSREDMHSRNDDSWMAYTDNINIDMDRLGRKHKNDWWQDSMTDDAN